MSWKAFKNYAISISTTLKALFARFLYLFFNMIAIWRVVVTLQNKYFLLFTILLIPLFVETAYTLINRHTVSLKWVNPSSFCFLLCGIPCIWLIELKLLQDRLNAKPFFSWIKPGTVSSSTAFGLTENDWLDGLEQFLVFVCIAAKWIAPKGNLSDHELSQLLLIYITNGADTTELLEIFDDERISNETYPTIVQTVLIVWSWSMLQFVFEMTSTKKFPFIPSKPGDASSTTSLIEKFASPDYSDDGYDHLTYEAEVFYKETWYNCFCFYNEIWGMVIMLIVQDIPYLIVRVYIALGFQIDSQLNIFFTFKNLFLLLLHLNRIRVIYTDDKPQWKGFKAKVVERQDEFNRNKLSRDRKKYY